MENEMVLKDKIKELRISRNMTQETVAQHLGVRKPIIEKSLENYGYILVAESMEQAIETANEIAGALNVLQNSRLLP